MPMLSSLKRGVCWGAVARCSSHLKRFLAMFEVFKKLKQEFPR